MAAEKLGFLSVAMALTFATIASESKAYADFSERLSFGPRACAAVPHDRPLKVEVVENLLARFKQFTGVGPSTFRRESLK